MWFASFLGVGDSNYKRRRRGRSIKASPMKLNADIFAQRVLEKAASRAADADALASGAKSREQLNEENGSFGFPANRVQIDFSKAKTKY